MSPVSTLLIEVDAESITGSEEAPDLLRRLRIELLDLGIEEVKIVADPPPPDGAKGLPGVNATSAMIYLGKIGLQAIVARLRQWVFRSGCSIEATIDGDTIKITGATPEQQDTVLNAWLQRHAAQHQGLTARDDTS